jgi:hypothetical protein
LELVLEGLLEELGEGLDFVGGEGESGGDQGVLDSVVDIDELLILEEDFGGEFKVALGDEEEGQIEGEGEERAGFLFQEFFLDREGVAGVFQEVEEFFVLEEIDDFLQAGQPAGEVPGVPGQFEGGLSVAFSGG